MVAVHRLRGRRAVALRRGATVSCVGRAGRVRAVRRGAVQASGRSLVVLVAVVIALSVGAQWWSARAQRALGSEVAGLARAGDIHMISSQTCVFCTLARSWFHEHGVAFSECFIERDAACRAAYDGARAPGTPLIVVRGVPQLGFRPERLRDALQRPA